MMGFRRFITDSLKDKGFASIGVGDPEGTYVYSVGFTDLGHPEIIISGLRADLCHRFLWDIFHEIEAGRGYHDGQVVTELANLPCVMRLITAEAMAALCCQGVYWYENLGKVPQYLQLVLPDRDGRFPWDAGFDQELMRTQRELWVTRH